MSSRLLRMLAVVTMAMFSVAAEGRTLDFPPHGDAGRGSLTLGGNGLKFPRKTPNDVPTHISTEDACESVEDPFGEAGRFNVVVFGDMLHIGGEIQGALAVGGDLQATGFGVGATLNPGGNAEGEGLVVQGDVSWQHGQLFHGDAHIGGEIVSLGTVVDGAVCHPSVPFDFDAARQHLRALSAEWAATPATGTTTVLRWAQLVLRGDDPDLNVFHVSEEQWKATGEVHLEVPAGASVIVNVDGVEDALQLDHPWFGAFFFNGRTDAAAWNRTVWNFHEARNLSVSGVGWKGSLLAPWAHLVYANGNIEGHVFVAELTETCWCAETHWVPFVGLLPPPCDPPDEPEPWFTWNEFAATAAEVYPSTSDVRSLDTRAGSVEVNYNGGHPWREHLGDPPYAAGILALRNGTGELVEQWQLNAGYHPRNLDAHGCVSTQPFPQCWVWPKGDEGVEAFVPTFSSGSNEGFDSKDDRVRVSGSSRMAVSDGASFDDNSHEVAVFTWSRKSLHEAARMELRVRYDWDLDGLDGDDLFIPIFRRGWRGSGPDMIAPFVVIEEETETTLTISVNAQDAMDYVYFAYVDLGFL